MASTSTLNVKLRHVATTTATKYSRENVAGMKSFICVSTFYGQSFLHLTWKMTCRRRRVAYLQSYGTI